ncbi:MAG: cytochrome c oxidase subunit I [Zetaproteobacteria bacterium]|nr:cytochrome c oxidase subunit I [Zetaproteobacteria bacterium]
MMAKNLPQTGIISWITTVDHKRIGIMYAVTALFFLLFGGIEAILMRTQLMVPNNDFVTGSTFNGLVTLHGTTMIFLFVMPLSAAFFNYLTPLMIGAPDVAYPRMNALSYWIFLFGGLLLNFSFVAGMLPDGGWFNYANLSGPKYSPTHGIDFWVLGVQVVGLASLIAAINFFVTILNMRCKGMTLLKMPIFIWTTLVTQVLLILSLPVITVALVMMSFDRSFGTGFFDPEMGGQVIMWQHLFWIFGHPEVYILILPAMGIVSEILATFSRKPLFGYSVMVYSTCAIGFLGFAVWAHHMFTTGLGPWAQALFSAGTMLIAVPTGVKIFNWISTLWGGQISFTTPMLFAVSFIAMFTMGGLSGVMHSSPPIDYQHQDSYFVVAHFHYVLYGGAVMALFGGIFYWFPKVTGRFMDETMGKIQFWLYMVGFNLTFFPMHFLGIQGMPRRIYTYAGDQGWNLWNLMATMGAYITALGGVLFFVNLIYSCFNGKRAGADCWDGRTLEWTLASPPPEYNFAVDPEVTQLDDFWVRKFDATGNRVEPALQPEIDPATKHLPNPSFWPLVLAFGILLLACGPFFDAKGIWLSVFGLGVMLLGTYGWSYEEA